MTPTPSTTTLVVPSTSANLGPGFDCLGLALGLTNSWTVQVQPGAEGGRCRVVACSGEGAKAMARDGKHLFFTTWRELHQRKLGPDLFDLLRKADLEVLLSADNGTPLARGLGSSAAVRVASCEAYLRLTGPGPFASWQLAAMLEGHPDNAAPAGLGGLVASFQEEDGVPQALALELHPCWQVVVAIPNFGLLTEEARKVLPRRYERPEALYNLGRLPFLMEGLRLGDGDLVYRGCRDRLHQGFRASLIPGFEDVLKAGRQAGAAAVFLSGAGPTVAAFVDRRQGDDLAARVAQAMARTFEKCGVTARVLELAIDYTGLRVKEGQPVV